MGEFEVENTGVGVLKLGILEWEDIGMRMLEWEFLTLGILEWGC